MNLDWNKYIEASVVGAGRGLIALPVEHPFDCVKTKLQANPGSSVSGIARGVFQTSGVRGFYAGAIPNGMRVAVKQVYRWPLMLALPPYFKGVLPTNIVEEYPAAAKTCSGFAMAHIETFIVCPAERMKVWLMTTSHERRHITRFFVEEKTHWRASLFRGTKAVYARQVASWVSFLAADGYFKGIERKKYPEHTTLPMLVLMKVAAQVGAVNTLVNMPFDTAKTRIQQCDSHANTSIIRVISALFKQHGIKALYAGWQVRMTQYMIQSLFTVTILEKLEQKWR